MTQSGDGRIFWQYGWPTEPTGPRIDITDRIAAHHVPGCDRVCLGTPAGPCADRCFRLAWPSAST